MSFKNHLIAIALVLAMLSPLAGRDAAQKPAPISPGNGNELGLVTGLTPTFSWAAVPWADDYRVVVFPGGDAGNLGYQDVRALANPILSREIPGGATSWTPSYGDKLAAGSLYVWFVQALDESGAGEWSAGGRFVVLSQDSLGQPEDRLKETLWAAGVNPTEAEGLVRDVKSGLAPDVPAGDSPNETSKPLGSENDGNKNVYYGSEAGGALTTFAFSNSMFGYNSGGDTTSGCANTFVGIYSGSRNLAGDYNTFIGAQSGLNTNSSCNTFVGANSGNNNSTGTDNAYLGYMSGCTATGSSNVFLGYYAGYSETGNHKLYIENSSSSSPLIYGEFNNDLVRINGNFQATGYLSLNAGTNQINAVELNILDGKTLATGSADNDQLVTKGYVDENDDVGAGLTGSALTSQVIPKWDDAGTQLVDSIISEGSGVVSVNGRLGVGTATPSQPFELVTTGEPAVLYVNRTGGAVMRMVAGEGNAQIGTVTNHLVKFVVNDAWKMKLNTDGTLLMSTGGSYNGTWNDASSIRFKENIRELSSEAAASALEELTPVTYNYKKFKDEERVGFIAEHVPEIVANNDRENLSAMDIVALLTRVVKDQQQTIRELKARVEELETQSR